jgi:hypothetical protein
MKTISPLLVDKTHRQQFTLHLPEIMMYGIREIAKSEDQSIGWVIEQDLLRLYGFPVEYKTPKKKRVKK